MAVECVRVVCGCMRSCNIQPESEVGSVRKGRSCAYSGRRRSSSGVLTSEDAAFDPRIGASVLHEVGRQHGAARGGWRCVPIRSQKRDARGPAGGAAPMGEPVRRGERLGRTIRGTKSHYLSTRVKPPQDIRCEVANHEGGHAFHRGCVVSIYILLALHVAM